MGKAAQKRAASWGTNAILEVLKPRRCSFGEPVVLPTHLEEHQDPCLWRNALVVWPPLLLESSRAAAARCSAMVLPSFCAFSLFCPLAECRYAGDPVGEEEWGNRIGCVYRRYA